MLSFEDLADSSAAQQTNNRVIAKCIAGREGHRTIPDRNSNSSISSSMEFRFLTFFIQTLLQFESKAAHEVIVLDDVDSANARDFAGIGKEADAAGFEPVIAPGVRQLAVQRDGKMVIPKLAERSVK